MQFDPATLRAGFDWAFRPQTYFLPGAAPPPGRLPDALRFQAYCGPSEIRVLAPQEGSLDETPPTANRRVAIRGRREDASRRLRVWGSR